MRYWMILASVKCMRIPDNMISCIKMSVLYLFIYFNTPYLTIHINISQYMGFLLGLSPDNWICTKYLTTTYLVLAHTTCLTFLLFPFDKILIPLWQSNFCWMGLILTHLLLCYQCILGLFTVGIFSSFSTHFPIIFRFIFIPFFLRLKLRMNKKN